jgi:predicted ATPase
LHNTNINHVSPLRAFPQRYYLLDKSAQHVKLNTLDGTELAEVIKKYPKIKEKINLLFAPFNIAIDIEKVNDIIHKIVVNQDAVQVELTDVGFGISQVLPVLVQAYLSPKQSITIIEQPEIHLHPKMQAWLTDALISIAIDEDKKFIIETHSEALIRRVRLRVVDPENKITKDDVSIYHVEKDSQKESSSKLTRVDMNDSGDITWPIGFMDVEINDTLLIQKIKFENSIKNKRAH